jgi:uncharacterized protein YrrD
MKRNIKSLLGFTVGGLDGEIGKVDEFYFDDESWTIRYLIVATGNWFSGRKVLISSDALLASDWNNKIFRVNLTIDEIKNSPDIDTEKPVSRQEEIKLNLHYPWRSYWEGALWARTMGTAGMVIPNPVTLGEDIPPEAGTKADSSFEGNQHLRSTYKVTDYYIQAGDGEIGKVEDFILDDESWKIDFIVVNTGNWLVGKKVLIAPDLIKKISWAKSVVEVKASVDMIKNSPEYDFGQPLSAVYSAKLQGYYKELNL